MVAAFVIGFSAGLNFRPLSIVATSIIFVSIALVAEVDLTWWTATLFALAVMLMNAGFLVAVILRQVLSEPPAPRYR